MRVYTLRVAGERYGWRCRVTWLHLVYGTPFGEITTVMTVVLPYGVTQPRWHVAGERVSHKRQESALQERPRGCPTRACHKSAPKECPTRVSRERVRQECPTKLSNNVWPMLGFVFRVRVRIRVCGFHVVHL